MRTIVQLEFLARNREDALRKIDQYMTQVYGHCPEYELPEIVLTPQFANSASGSSLVGVEVSAWVWING